MKGDFDLDEKQRSVSLTEAGNEHIEELLAEAGLLEEGSLYDAANVTLVHHVNQALRAHTLFQRDKDYIVRNDEVVIIDEFTGRMMPGRRYSEGLHQALEAKEHVQVQPENQTLASITFQNYFRLYKKLAGMTGTAATEADEFLDIYKLDVVEIPTNVAVQPRRRGRRGLPHGRREAARRSSARSRPPPRRASRSLVGTTSIEKSEQLADFMVEQGYKQIDFDRSPTRWSRSTRRRARGQAVEDVRRAERPLPRAGSLHRRPGRRARRDHHRHQHGRPRHRHPARRQRRHAHPARARANIEERGRARGPHRGSATEIAEFKQKALAAGGLYVIGTERHESRRIDNQLRGRSGRQGDPGRSKFFLSLQDDLMRIFGSERMDGMLQKLGLKEDEAIVHPWINKAIEKAQQKVEARNFDMRKNILKYDDVMNDQRKVVFEQRREFMAEESVRETIDDMRHDVVDDVVAKHIPEDAYPEQWDIAGLDAGRPAPAQPRSADRRLGQGRGHRRRGDPRTHQDRRRRRLCRADREEHAEVMTYVEKQVLLQMLDHLWREHLVTLDHLRQVIGWRGYAQRDPLNEYKSEAFELFDSLITHLREQVTAQLMRVEVMFAAARGAGTLPRCRHRTSTPRRARTNSPALDVGAARRSRPGLLGDDGTSRSRPRPERPVDLGPRRPQRGLPLRLRQEVQALPRPVRLRIRLGDEADADRVT